MRVYRISDPAYWNDRTGYGSALHGGRWNDRDVPCIYAASTIELAVLEKRVHVPTHQMRPYVLAALDLPDDEGLYARPALEDLPEGWDALPPAPASIDYGTRWLREGAALGLFVPSVVVPEARNLLINSNHPRAGVIAFTRLREFVFDRRLMLTPDNLQAQGR